MSSEAVGRKPKPYAVGTCVWCCICGHSVKILHYRGAGRYDTSCGLGVNENELRARKPRDIRYEKAKFAKPIRTIKEQL